MIHYPLSFKVSSSATQGIQASWSTRADAMPEPVLMAIPPEFEGPGGGFSPEDIYAFALMNCFIATFKVIAEKSKLEYKTLHTEATLTVDRNESGVPWMKALHLKVELGGAQDQDRTKRLLEKTSQSCMILNSVKTEKTFEFLVMGS
ncbi:MAG: OsmC family protein [Bdellovibrionales bacterium]|nr:OsmC family protein [Bdellovibrionales bacterium]